MRPVEPRLPTGSAAATRLRLADAVVAETRHLVELTGRNAWMEVPARIALRRSRLIELERALRGSGPEARAEGEPTLAALRAAVLESERVLAWLLPREDVRSH